MKKFKQFIFGIVTGWSTLIAFIVVWIMFMPHSSYDSDLQSQIIVLDNNEKILFTFNRGCVQAGDPDTPVLTYLRDNNNWESHSIPEGYVSREDEYILSTSKDKSVVYFILPQRNEGFKWDLVDNKFEQTNEITSIELGKKYLHEIP